MKKLIVVSALLLTLCGCWKAKRTCVDDKGAPKPCFGSLR